MGGIQFEKYIADFAAATVNVENKKHPVLHCTEILFSGQF